MMTPLAVQPKTELGVSRRGAIVHRIGRLRASLHNGRIRYSASWLCGNSAADAVLLDSADAHGGAVCVACAEGADGVFVYRCYDQSGVLLYVGYTSQLGIRMQAHRRSPWWPRVANVTRQQCETVTAAMAAERLAIQQERPLLNKQWATA